MSLKRNAGIAVLSLALFSAAQAAPKEKSETEKITDPDDYEFRVERIVRLNDDVNDKSALEVIRKLKYLDAHTPDKKDITLIINSDGGHVTQGLAIYDTMRSLKSDVRTVCEGRAYSMGAFLVAAGTPGKRYALPSCRMMFHEISAGNSGKYSDMNIYHKELGKQNDILMDDLSGFLNRRKDDLKRILAKDYYVDPAQAKELGAIDEILEPRKARRPAGTRPLSPE